MFTYSTGSIDGNYSVAKILYRDKRSNFDESVESVEDAQLVKEFGIVSKEILGFGVTSREQARRMGLWLLSTNRFENQTVNELALLVKKVIGDNVKIKKIKSNDDRSYHISSKKIEKILGFKAEKTIEDAVIELKNAFVTKKLNDTLSNEFYFNIKRMNNIHLK